MCTWVSGWCNSSACTGQTLGAETVWGKQQTSEPSSAGPAFHLGDCVHVVLNWPASPSLSGSRVLYGVKRTSLPDEGVTPHWTIGRMELTHSIE